jgi:hypothetical protein
MSDEQQRQQVQVAQAEAQAGTTGDRWGDPISIERQVQLQGYLDRWWAAETDHGERKGPFDTDRLGEAGVQLTGADVFWLAAQSGRNERGAMPNLHVEGANLRYAHLETLYVNPSLAMS